MKKSKFIKSALILMIGGMFTKLLGMIIRILTSRILGKTGIGLYSLVMPTFMLFIALCQLGFPVAISKLVAEENRNNKKLVLGLIPISLILNFILMITLFLIAPILSKYLLHEERCTYAIMAIGTVLPFISISSILRGYFFGKEKMAIHVFSNIMEDIVRIILILIFLPTILKINLELSIAFLVFSNLASELTSILIFLFFLPKNQTLKKNDFILDKKNKHDILFVNYSGDPLSRQGLWKILKEYSQKADIKIKLTPQTMRNSFAIHMLQNGADVKALQELLGNEDISAIQIYVAATKSRIKDVYDRTHPRA